MKRIASVKTYVESNGCISCFARDRRCSIVVMIRRRNEQRSCVDGKERGEDGKRIVENEKRRKGRTDPSRARARIESELDLRLRGIKTFETSTGQQDRLQLNHSSSGILFHSSFLDMLLPPFLPLCLSLLLFLPLRPYSRLSLSSVAPASTSLSPRIHLDPSDPGSLIPSSSSPKLVFVSYLSLLRYRVPISGGLSASRGVP